MSAGAEQPVFRHEPLDRQHSRAAFSCGEPRLDSYLQRYATQDRSRHLASVFVLADSDGTIAAFYTLNAAGVEREVLPPGTVRGPYDTIPATLLGRLAVDRRYQGRRLGDLVLLNALFRALRQSAQVAAALVIVDAIDERAARLYGRGGFAPLPEAPSRLYLPMATIARYPFTDPDLPVTL